MPRRMTGLHVPGFTLALLALAPAARGQDASPAPAPLPEPTPAAAPAPAAPDLGAEIATMKRRMEAQAEEIQQLHQRLGDIENETQKQTIASQRLRIYGFASIIMARNWIKPGTMMDGLGVDRLTFGIGDFNLYVDSQLSERWRFLGEVRFVLAPLTTQSYNSASGELEFFNTKDYEIFTGGAYQWTALYLERVQVEYRWSDLLTVTAGRFLTPYGIWNVEHGSPVLIPVRMPYPVLDGIVPRAQTGVQASGRVFPAEGLQLDYALTASNGRGPVDLAFDRDDNKALGLRLRLGWERNRSRVALGSYLYAGQYSDRVKSMDYVAGVTSSAARTQYDEQIAAFDLLAEHGPVRVQAEYMRQAVKYAAADKRPMTQDYRGYEPDHIRQGAYGLVAVRLPALPVDLRVYGMLEWYNPGTVGAVESFIYTGGLNWRATPAVVMKAECFKMDFRKESVFNTDWWGITTQLAVSF